MHRTRNQRSFHLQSSVRAGDAERSARKAQSRGGWSCRIRVVRNGVMLGTLTRTGSDMPWWQGEFDPAPGFESIRPMFDRERELLEADEDMDAWGLAWDELAVGMVLEPLDGRATITEFLLHIEADGRQASWRY